jgi:hypothetical protein
MLAMYGLVSLYFRLGDIDIRTRSRVSSSFFPLIGWGFAMLSKSRYAPMFASAVCPGARLYWMLLVFSLTIVLDGLYPSNGLRELAVATGAANAPSMREVKAKIDKAKLIEWDLAILRLLPLLLFLVLEW